MKKLFVFLGIVFISFAAIAQSSKEKSVWASVEALTNAIFGQKDSAALVRLVSENVTYGHSGGNIENKTVMIQNAIGNRGSYKNIQIERISINVNGKTAVLRHNLRGVSVDARGAESPLDLGILQVWRREKGRWQIWARQAVRIPAER